jgi:hypothetical protein
MRRFALIALLAAALPTNGFAYDPSDVDGAVADGSCLVCNLAGADLQGRDLSGIDAAGANLRGANLSGANLEDGSFDNADLRGAKLTGANLIGTSFIGANLDGADLSGAQLFNTELVGASLDGTNFAGTDLEGALDAELGRALGLPATPTISTTATYAVPDLSTVRAGSILLVAFAYCPHGTHEADGTAVQSRDNQILYSLFGNTYGGDNIAFHLPDLRQEVPLAGMRYCVALGGVYPERP